MLECLPTRVPGFTEVSVLPIQDFGFWRSYQLRKPTESRGRPLIEFRMLCGAAGVAVKNYAGLPLGL